jgi:DNA-binding beta-propeller fold protein YncE
MIKQFFKFSALSLIVLLGFTSCTSDDNPEALPKGNFDNGYIISNEGNFGTPNASVTFIDNTFMQKTDDVFQSTTGKTLGDVLQAITFNDDYAFLVINNSSKIEVVNRYTFESVATITDKLKAPRYAVVEEGKLYVTNSGKKTVEVYDANNFAHITTIIIDRTVEELLEENGFLYVMNASFGSGKDITVVNTQTNSVVKTITVGDGLNSIEIEDGILYALHNTGITKITTSNNAIIGEITFEEGITNASKLEIEGNFIYFISGSKIFKFNKDIMSLIGTELVDTGASSGPYSIGYGFNVINDKIFYTDAKGFTQNSEVKVYDLNGKLLKTFTAGIGANGVYEND